MEFPLYNSRISVYSLTDYIHSPSLPFLLILSHQVDGHFNQCHCNVSQFTSFEYKRYQASRTAPELVGRQSVDRRRTVVVGFSAAMCCWLGPVWLVMLLRESLFYRSTMYYYILPSTILTYLVVCTVCMVRGNDLVATSSGKLFFYSSVYSKKDGNKPQHLFSIHVSAYFYV